jgi:hypothetical protein
MNNFGNNNGNNNSGGFVPNFNQRNQPNNQGTNQNNQQPYAPYPNQQNPMGNPNTSGQPIAPNMEQQPNYNPQQPNYIPPQQGNYGQQNYNQQQPSFPPQPNMGQQNSGQQNPAMLPNVGQPPIPNRNNNTNIPPNFQQQNQQDEYFNNPYNQNGYSEINQESMHDFYEYKQSKTKLVAYGAVFLISFIFVLGVFTSPFINGSPMVLSQDSRSILSYSNNIQSKTASMFARDSQYYQLANDLGLGVVSSNVNLDNDISKEIKDMTKLIDDLKLIDTTQATPVGFDGPDGLHVNMIKLLQTRIDRLNDLRKIAQGQVANVPAFNAEFIKYIGIRNNIITAYNNKYEANFHKTLYDVKELEFNVQEKK